jgi:hypothetical protein
MPRTTDAPSGSSSAQVRHHQPGELHGSQRFVQQQDRNGYGEQWRQIAERARHHRAERAIGGERQDRQDGRKDQADGGEDRHGAPFDDLAVQQQRREQKKDDGKRGNADRRAGQWMDVA